MTEMIYIFCDRTDCCYNVDEDCMRDNLVLKNGLCQCLKIREESQGG